VSSIFSLWVCCGQAERMTRVSCPLSGYIGFPADQSSDAPESRGGPESLKELDHLGCNLRHHASNRIEKVLACHAGLHSRSLNGNHGCFLAHCHCFCTRKPIRLSKMHDMFSSNRSSFGANACQSFHLLHPLHLLTGISLSLPMWPALGNPQRPPQPSWTAAP
jgi:hypothetical protein